MTAGQEALREAARAESARIYGQTSSAFTGSSTETSRPVATPDPKVTDIRVVRNRKAS